MGVRDITRVHHLLYSKKEAAINTDRVQCTYYPGNECSAHSSADCAGLDAGSASGIYTICPQGEAKSVYCDMETDSGGWTVRTCILFYFSLYTSIQIRNIQYHIFVASHISYSYL